MLPLKIHRRINNLEVLSKLMNATARKCDCRITYDRETERLHFDGDPESRRYIIESLAKQITFRR